MGGDADRVGKSSGLTGFCAGEITVAIQGKITQYYLCDVRFKDLYHGSSHFVFSHSKQCNETEARRKSNLFLYASDKTVTFVDGSTGNQTNTTAP